MSGMPAIEGEHGPQRKGSGLQVVILAGGLGTRLQALTRTVPKPMVEVAGRPFLERQVGSLVAQGFSRLLLLVGHLAEPILDHFRDGSEFGAEIRYSRESGPLGTGGALRLAHPMLEDRFLLLYGDSFLPEPIGPIARSFEQMSDGGLMTVYRDDHRLTGVAPNLAIDSAGRVIRYQKGGDGKGLQYIDAGLLGLRSRFLEWLPPDRPASLESDFYPLLIARTQLMAWKTQDPFCDIGTPARLERARDFFRELREEK